nr:MAG TPA: hypothetical protein [Caudoviricetes sp.]
MSHLILQLSKIFSVFFAKSCKKKKNIVKLTLI